MDNGYIKINIFFPGHNVPGQCFFFSFTQTKQKLTFFFNTKLSYRCVCVLCVWFDLFDPHDSINIFFFHL